MRRETIHAWLLLLPALVLLVAFTHWPAIATLIDSLYATPHGSRPAPFVGLDNYTDLLDDPVFWQALRNNAWYARRDDPGVDRARVADGAGGERGAARPGAAAHGLFPADHAADDRGRQHLDVLLHAGLRLVRPHPGARSAAVGTTGWATHRPHCRR